MLLRRGCYAASQRAPLLSPPCYHAVAYDAADAPFFSPLRLIDFRYAILLCHLFSLDAALALLMQHAAAAR